MHMTTKKTQCVLACITRAMTTTMQSKIWETNDRIEFMAEGAIQFTAQELCRKIIPAMLKP